MLQVICRKVLGQISGIDEASEINLANSTRQIGICTYHLRPSIFGREYM